jgi:ribosomal protein S27AE
MNDVPNNVTTPTRYCYKCGEKCIIAGEVHHYDGDTGKPVLVFKATCPNANKLVPMSLHTKNQWCGGYNTYDY